MISPRSHTKWQYQDQKSGLLNPSLMSLIYICLTLSQQAEGIGKQTYSKYKKNISIIAVEWWNGLSYKM